MCYVISKKFLTFFTWYEQLHILSVFQIYPEEMSFNSLLYSPSLPVDILVELYNLFHKVIVRNSYVLLPLEPYILSTLIFII